MNTVTTLDFLPLLLGVLVCCMCVRNISRMWHQFHGRFLLTIVAILFYIAMQARWILGDVSQLEPDNERVIWSVAETLLMLSIFFLAKIPMDAKFR